MGFADAFTAEANEALDGIKNAPEAIQEAVTAFLNDPGGFIGDLVKAGLGDFGELLGLIELRSNPKHPYDAGQRNGKLAFRALGFLGGAGLSGLAARAPMLFKLLTGRRKPKGDGPSTLLERGVQPLPGTRLVPKGIPSNWRVRPTKGEGGALYYDPKNKGNSVRVMQGSPGSKFPNSQAPYVRWQRNGQALDVTGKVVSKQSADAHIPLEDFQFNPALF